MHHGALAQCQQALLTHFPVLYARVEHRLCSCAEASDWWEDSAVTGAGNIHEPSGWQGDLRLQSHGTGYANCTSARAYTSSTLAPGQAVAASAQNQAWLSDNLCSDKLPRFVRPRALLHCTEGHTAVKTVLAVTRCMYDLLLGPRCFLGIVHVQNKAST